MSEIKRGPAAAFAGAMIVLAMLAGCASAVPHAPASQGETPEDAAHHHHGPSAAPPEAVAPGQPAKTLSPDALDAPAPTSVLDAQRSAEMAGGHGGHGDHGAHGVAGYRHVDAGRGPGAYEGSEKQTPGGESHQHDHAPAPPASGHEGHSHESHGAAEGATEGEDAAVYVCPMHLEVTSKAPGKCPKCGMALVERRKG